MTDLCAIQGQLVDVRNVGTHIGRPPVPLAVRFEQQYIPEPNSGCWLWMGAMHHGGYGTIKDGNRKALRANRVSWELHHGAIAAGLCVLHRCDTPLCVNPDHLFLGTNAENTRDMFAKGRQNDRRGSACRSKLTEDQVHAIRADIRTRAAIATAFDISPVTVWAIKTKRRWSHL